MEVDVKSQKEYKGRTLISESELKYFSIKLLYWGIFLFLTFIAFIELFPLVWSLFGALKSSSEIFKVPPSLLPEPHNKPLQWGWINYLKAWQQANFPKYFLNTAILALGVWIFQVLTTALAGYALAKLNVPASRQVLLLFLCTLMVPFQAIMIPLYLTVRKVPLVGINLLDTYWAIILPSAANAFNIFLFRGFFQQVPQDLLEAAKIDGASDWSIFWQVVLPLSKPILATVSIITLNNTWNSFLWPYLVLTQEDKFPIMLKLYQFSTRGDIPWNVVLAALLITSLPLVIIFLLFQKHIVRGIAFSGLKS